MATATKTKPAKKNNGKQPIEFESHPSMVIRQATFTIEGVQPMLFGRRYEDDVPRRADEPHEKYEERTWLERVNEDRDRHLCIPGRGIQMGLRFAGKWTRRKVAGMGGSEYSKRFAGAINAQPTYKLLSPKGEPLTRETITNEEHGYRYPMYVPPDGRTGGAKRVLKYFPALEIGWKSEIVVEVWDERITEEIFAEFIYIAGFFDGMGAMRPGNENGGLFGRYILSGPIGWNEL